MIYTEENLEKECIKTVMGLIAGAIKTAPKTRGINALKTIVLTDEDKDKLSEKMASYEKHPFPRDAKNIKEADAVILIGVKTIYMGLDCGFCGHKNCKESAEKNGICIYNVVDLGIALGSAVSSLQDFKIDNRIMYTAGYAAKNMGLFEDEYKIVMGIPLKISRKNIFFDRK